MENSNKIDLQDQIRDTFKQCVNPTILINPDMLAANLEIMFRKAVIEAYNKGVENEQCYVVHKRTPTEYFNQTYKTDC